MALLSAAYEYCLVALPVASYVGLEAFARKEGLFFLKSPEWAIATIFLLFQGSSLYVRGLDRTGRGLWHLSLGLLAMVVLVLIAIAAINAFNSLESLHAARADSGVSMVVRFLLFALASALFFLLVAAGRLAALKVER